jgi:hypothetical protein
MLAPIYGIGLGPFGSMTDFSTLTNRPGGDMANEYIVAPEGYTPRAKAHSAKVKLHFDRARHRDFIHFIFLRFTMLVRQS